MPNSTIPVSEPPEPPFKISDREAAVAAGNATFNSRDYAEGIAAFSEKRSAVFSGE